MAVYILCVIIWALAMLCIVLTITILNLTARMERARCLILALRQGKQGHTRSANPKFNVIDLKDYRRV